MYTYMHTKEYVNIEFVYLVTISLPTCLPVYHLSIYLSNVSIIYLYLFKNEFKYEYSYHLPLNEGTFFFLWGGHSKSKMNF